MNYCEPRQKYQGLRWDFTKQNGDDIFPIGYCQGWKPYWDDGLPGEIEQAGVPVELATIKDSVNLLPLLPLKAYSLHLLPGNDPREALQQYKSKYHSTGHATAEEAAECYKEYLLDHTLRLFQRRRDKQEKCVICFVFTNLYATLDNARDWSLCEDHNTRHFVDTLYRAPMHIISSY